MDCQNKEQNLRNCNCTYTCPRKGICCECLAYHRDMNQLPACYFPAEAEKTYNRSISYFVKLKNEGRI